MSNYKLRTGVDVRAEVARIKRDSPQEEIPPVKLLDFEDVWMMPAYKRVRQAPLTTTSRHSRLLSHTLKDFRGDVFIEFNADIRYVYNVQPKFLVSVGDLVQIVIQGHVFTMEHAKAMLRTAWTKRSRMKFRCNTVYGLSVFRQDQYAVTLMGTACFDPFAPYVPYAS